MPVLLDADTEYLRRASIPSGGTGTLTDGGFKNFLMGVWCRRPTEGEGNSFALSSEGRFLHGQAGAREVFIGLDNNFGAGTAHDPRLLVTFNSGGGTGATQTFSTKPSLGEWAYYFFMDNTEGQHAGYLTQTDPRLVVITRANDNATSQYVNTLTIGNNNGGTTVAMGAYAYARAVYRTGLSLDDVVRYAMSTRPMPGDWGFWRLGHNTDTADYAGWDRNLTFTGTLESAASWTDAANGTASTILRALAGSVVGSGAAARMLSKRSRLALMGVQ